MPLRYQAQNPIHPDDPKSLFRELRERYASLQSYQDDGIVITEVKGEHGYVQETKFATWFTRPRRFRFDYVTHHPYPPLKHITTESRIWQSDEGVFYWSERGGTEKLSRLHLAISGAKGVSDNSSYTVPALLLASRPVFLSEKLTLHAVIEGETEGIPCHCITAKDRLGWPYRLYVGRDDLLLHRVWSIVMDDTTSNEIHRNIRVNHTIDEHEFRGPSQAEGDDEANGS